jgi:hypothetical protein
MTEAHGPSRRRAIHPNRQQSGWLDYPISVGESLRERSCARVFTCEIAACPHGWRDLPSTLYPRQRR